MSATGLAVRGMPPRSAAAAAEPASDRVPVSQKVGYGLGAFIDMWGHWLYPSLAFHVFNVFLGVAPGLVSTAQMVKVGIDAASDAIFGWVSDNTRTRYGRRRPFILVGGVLAGIGLPMMFAVGRGWSDTEYFIFIMRDLATAVGFLVARSIPWLRTVEFKARILGKVVTVLQLATLAAVLVLPDAVPLLLAGVATASVLSIADYTLALWRARAT